jgi:hypothetical protein
MLTALCQLLAGNFQDVNLSTKKALHRQGLVGENNLLTNEGWTLAVEASALSVQCAELGLEVIKLNGLDFEGQPENAAYEYFATQGFMGGSCEGGALLLLIRAAALDYLHEVNTFRSRVDACNRFTEAQLWIHKDKISEICSAIELAKPSDIMRNFREIYKNPEICEIYPKLDSEKILAISSALTMPRLSSIVRAIAEDPYTFRSGWPDLTLVDKGGNLLWAEVKTTDKLHRSQITTITKMRPLLPGKVVVVHLK